MRVGAEEEGESEFPHKATVYPCETATANNAAVIDKFQICCIDFVLLKADGPLRCGRNKGDF